MKKKFCLCLTLAVVLSTTGCMFPLSRSSRMASVNESLQQENEDLQAYIDSLEQENEDLYESLEAYKYYYDYENGYDDYDYDYYYDLYRDYLESYYSDDYSDSSNDYYDSTYDSNFDSEEVAARLTTSEYYYTEADGSVCLIIIVKNGSAYGLSLDIDIDFYDANGRLINRDYDYGYALETDYETAYTFYCDTEYSYYDVTLNPYQTSYEPCQSSLSNEVSIEGSNVSVTFSNNSAREMEDIFYTLLYYNGDELVGTASDYIYQDEDGYTIKAGSTATAQETFDRPFDSVKVYYMVNFTSLSSLQSGLYNYIVNS